MGGYPCKIGSDPDAKEVNDIDTLSAMRLAAKIEAGARFIQVQAVFELAAMQRWMAAVVERGLHERAHVLP